MAKKIVNNKQHNYIFYIVFAVFAFILYGNTLQNGYSLDDTYVTYKNEKIQKGIKAIPEILTSQYVSIYAEGGDGKLSFGYRPMAQITFAIEHELFGDNPKPQHLFNVLYYALSHILLFIVLNKLFGDKYKWFSFLLVLIWASHPLHTEVVASLKNREELLALIFALVSIIFFIKYAETHKFKHLIIASCIYFLSNLSKFSTPSFLLIVPLSLYMFKDLKGKRIVWVALALLIPMVVFAYFEFYAFGTVSRPYLYYENPLFVEGNFFDKVGTGMIGLLYYLKMHFFPHPLIYYYGYNMVPIGNIFHPLAIVSILIHLGLLILAVVLFKKNKIVSFFLIFYVAVMSTYSNILSIVPGIIAERYTFISSIAFAAILVYFIYKILKVKPDVQIATEKKWYSLLLALIVIIPYTLKTIDRNKDWKSEETLFKNDIRYAEKSAKANYFYASHLKTEYVRNMGKNNPQYNLTQQEKIIKHLSNAISIDSNYIDAINSLGEVYSMAQNNQDKAIEQFRRAVTIKPDFADGWYNLGYAYFQKSDYAKALVGFKKAAEIKKHDYRAFYNLSTTYNKLSYTDSAIMVMDKFIELNPELPFAYEQNGIYYLMKTGTLQAVKYLEKAHSIDASNKRVNGLLKQYYLSKNDSENAARF